MEHIDKNFYEKKFCTSPGGLKWESWIRTGHFGVKTANDIIIIAIVCGPLHEGCNRHSIYYHSVCVCCARTWTPFTITEPLIFFQFIRRSNIIAYIFALFLYLVISNFCILLSLFLALCFFTNAIKRLGVP